MISNIFIIPNRLFSHTLISILIYTHKLISQNISVIAPLSDIE